MNYSESDCIAYYQGVFDTYAELHNSIAQNISYSFIFAKIEPNDTNGILKILSEVFVYEGSKIILEDSNVSAFKKITL